MCQGETCPAVEPSVCLLPAIVLSARLSLTSYPPGQTHLAAAVMCSSSQTQLKQERNFRICSFSFEEADGRGGPIHTAPLGRPGGEIRLKLPVRKREDFSQSLSLFSDIPQSLRPECLKILSFIYIVLSGNILIYSWII